MLKLTLYFDSEKVRKNFLNDFSGLIVWHDRQQDDELRVFYEDAVTFAVPDLEGYDPSLRLKIFRSASRYPHNSFELPFTSSIHLSWSWSHCQLSSNAFACAFPPKLQL